MASSSAKHLLPFLLLTFLSSPHIAHARDSEFFNKLPTTTNSNVIPEEEQPLNNQQQPNFLPENYIGYSQKSSNLPPSSASTTVPDHGMESSRPLNMYRPKNYNSVAYVTQPDDLGDATSFTNYENSKSYPDTQQDEEEEEEHRSYPTTTANNRNNYDNYYGSSFNSDPLGTTTGTRFMVTGAESEKYINNGGETDGYQPQGMSDTRSLEGGKYFYDVYSEKHSSNQPYTRLNGAQARNDQYSDSENTYEFHGENSIRGYQNQNDFQDEEDNGGLP